MEKIPVDSLNREINEYTVNKTQGKPWLLVLLSILSRQIQCYVNNKREKTHESSLKAFKEIMSTTVLHRAELGSMTGNYNNIEESQWCTDSVKLLVAQSCPTLCDWWTISLPGSSVHGILQATILEWVAYFLLQGIFLTQGSNLGLSHCRQILYCLSHQGSPIVYVYVCVCAHARVCVCVCVCIFN